MSPGTDGVIVCKINTRTGLLFLKARGYHLMHGPASCTTFLRAGAHVACPKEILNVHKIAYLSHPEVESDWTVFLQGYLTCLSLRQGYPSRLRYGCSRICCLPVSAELP